MKLNEKLFNQFNEQFGGSFFNGEKTIKDLRVELCRADIPLSYVLKSVEQLFYMVFDEEDYEIKDILGTEQSTQYIVVDKTQGYELTFDYDIDKYMVFHVIASGVFFANQYSVIEWYEFLKLVDEAHRVIYEYEHEDE